MFGTTNEYGVMMTSKVSNYQYMTLESKVKVKFTQNL